MEENMCIRKNIKMEVGKEGRKKKNLNREETHFSGGEKKPFGIVSYFHTRVNSSYQKITSFGKNGKKDEK